MLSRTSKYFSSALRDNSSFEIDSVFCSNESGEGSVKEISLIRWALLSNIIGPYTSPSCIESSANSNSGGKRVPSVIPKSPCISFVPSSSEISVTRLLNSSPFLILFETSSSAIVASNESLLSLIFNIM